MASVLLIVLATLSPGHWTETKGRPEGVDGRIAGILLNVALFIPLGATLGHRGCSISRALFVGALLSGTIEIVQLGVPGRITSLEDVVSNTVGTMVGLVFRRTAPVWIRPGPRIASRFALAAASMASAIVGLTGLLLQPSFPPTKYFGGWAHEFGHLEVYRGRVLEASLGGVSILPGPIADSPEIRRRLIAGETLRVGAVAGPPVTGFAPILSIHDEHRHEILLLGPDREDLVYRFRTRAEEAGFDRPELRVPGAMRGVRAGGPLLVVVRPVRNGYCVEANRTTTCGIGFTAGAGWALLVYGQGLPPWTHGIWNVLWMAGLLFPVGYWIRARWECAFAMVLLASAVFLLPGATGLAHPPAGELAAALAGFLGGVILAWLISAGR